jgi:ABC-type sugar transport system permease subunit
MRLDAQRERELARRKGLALRTVLTVIWLVICFAVAYILVAWMFNNDVMSFRFFRRTLLIPYTISDTIIIIGFTIVIVVAINFIILVLYGLLSPIGRRRPGTASMYSADPDPEDQRYDYH